MVQERKSTMPASKKTGKTAQSKTRAQPDEEGGNTKPAVDLIRDHILNLSLAPGTRVDDRLLMEQFGMGRTPAREAFNRLAVEGFIIIQRNKGAYVRPLDIEQVRQFFDAYGASERLVGFFCRTRDPHLVDNLQEIETQYEAVSKDSLYLDMTRLNSEFHKRIATASANEYICDFASRLYNHARRLSYFIYLMPSEHNRNLQGMQRSITGHHSDIIAAIERHDNNELIRVLTFHAELFHHWIMQAIGVIRGLQAPLPDTAP
jgi:DNA-binding GntR family transcriptional regulator